MPSQSIQCQLSVICSVLCLLKIQGQYILNAMTDDQKVLPYSKMHPKKCLFITFQHSTKSGLTLNTIIVSPQLVRPQNRRAKLSLMTFFVSLIQLLDYYFSFINSIDCSYFEFLSPIEVFCYPM